MTQKVNNVAELKALRDKARDEVELRGAPKGIVVNVHMGTCGIAAGARDVLAELAETIGSEGLTDVTLRQSGCAGLCSEEPMLTVKDRAGVEFRYGRLDKLKVRQIVREHLVGGHAVAEHLVRL